MCIILQICSRNPVRRRGVVGCIRTCLFDKDIHWWVVTEIKGLTQVGFHSMCMTCSVVLRVLSSTQLQLLLPLAAGIPIAEADRVGMDPVIWLQVIIF